MKHRSRQYDGYKFHFRANHLSHGIVALQRLGARDKEIEPFVEKYKKRLVPKEKLVNHDTVKSEVTEDYLGSLDIHKTGSKYLEFLFSANLFGWSLWSFLCLF